jgi:signal transduction histidine kinase
MHNLGNLLAPLRLYADLLERGALPASAQANVGEEMRRVVDRIMQMISLIGELDAPAYTSPIRPRVVIDRVVETLPPGWQDRVDVDVCPGCPEVLGDVGQLVLAIQLLCDNSIEALRERNGALTLSARTHPNEAGVVVLEVRDAGRGIPSDMVPRVCDAFVTTKPPSLGAGLGLSVVSSIVARHKGALHLSSEVDAGTTVRIDLPRASR